MTCEQIRLSLGAFVLGALDREEGLAVESHTRRCSACRAELAELRTLPALLDQVHPDDIPTASGRQARRSPAWWAPLPHRTRRFAPQRAGLVAGLVLALLAGAVFGGMLLREAPARPQPPAASSPPVDEPSADVGTALVAIDARTHVAARADLVSRGWGTSIQLRLDGVPPGQICRLVAVARDGIADTAATWKATYQGRADVPGATSLTTAELTALRVITPDGQVLVEIPLHK